MASLLSYLGDLLASECFSASFGLAVLFASEWFHNSPFP